jgi:hypothetical protein
MPWPVVTGAGHESTSLPSLSRINTIGSAASKVTIRPSLVAATP